jgi:hypothetical protein
MTVADRLDHLLGSAVPGAALDPPPAKRVTRTTATRARL